jgi:hypothetical protein
MILPDLGIIFEIIGFLLLLFTSGRNPTSGNLVLNSHKDDSFDIFRKKIITDKYVHISLIVGIAVVIVGLILQFSNFN